MPTQLKGIESKCHYIKARSLFYRPESTLVLNFVLCLSLSPSLLCPPLRTNFSSYPFRMSLFIHPSHYLVRLLFFRLFVCYHFCTNENLGPLLSCLFCLHLETFYFELVLLVSNRDIVLFGSITTLVHSRQSSVHHKLQFLCRHLKSYATFKSLQYVFCQCPRMMSISFATEISTSQMIYAPCALLYHIICILLVTIVISYEKCIQCINSMSCLLVPLDT